MAYSAGHDAYRPRGPCCELSSHHGSRDHRRGWPCRECDVVIVGPRCDLTADVGNVTGKAAAPPREPVYWPRRVSTAVPCRSANSPMVTCHCGFGVHGAIRTRSLRLRTPPLWSIELRGRHP